MDEYDYQQIMNISSSNTVLKPMIKSQYRGVYRCGKKWKVNDIILVSIIMQYYIFREYISPKLGSNAK